MYEIVRCCADDIQLVKGYLGSRHLITYCCWEKCLDWIGKFSSVGRSTEKSDNRKRVKFKGLIYADTRSYAKSRHIVRRVEPLFESKRGDRVLEGAEPETSCIG